MYIVKVVEFGLNCKYENVLWCGQKSERIQRLKFNDKKELIFIYCKFIVNFFFVLFV